MIMSFTVHCTHCETEFPVDPDKVPDGGVRARCTNCEGIFFVDVPAEMSAGAETDIDMGVTAVAAAPGTAEPAAEAFEAFDTGFEASDEELEVTEPEIDEPETIPEATDADLEAPEVEAVEAAESEAEPAFEADPMATFDEPAFEQPAFGEPAFEEPVPDEPVMEAVVEEETPVAGETPVAEEVGLDDLAGGLTIEPEEHTFEPPMAEADVAPVEEVAEPVETPDLDPVLDPTDDWVLETEETVQPTEVEIDRLDTVEEQVRGLQDETYEAAPSEGIERVLPGDEEETFSGYTAGEHGTGTIDPLADSGAGTAFDAAPVEESSVEEEAPNFGEAPMLDEAPAIEEPVAPAPPAEEPAAKPAAFTFGKRDPHDKARRLARVLVSDMITYNPDRHTRALENNSIREDFEEEIAKSWQEYVDQVGAEIAESTDYWTQALNDVLAKGEQLF